MQMIFPGAGIGHRYLADLSDTVAPALTLAQALATSAWSFLPPARISTTDFGPRGICLLRSITLPSPIFTPTAGLPPLLMVHRRMSFPLFHSRSRIGVRRKLLRPAAAVKRSSARARAGARKAPP